MHIDWRVPISVAGLMWADVALRAQTTGLPPIFAPRAAVPTTVPTTSNSEEGQSSHLSSRGRQLVNMASERVLAEAKQIESGPPASRPDATLESESLRALSRPGAIMLPRYVVKSTALSRQEVQRPDLPPVRPYVVEREGRPGIITGYTFPLWRSSGGERESNLNLIDFGGRGVDHAKEFGRVELEFKIRF